MVASDRISAFDYVFPTEIPDKGAILTAMSLWWFEQLADIVPNHLVATSVDDYPAEFAPYAEALRGRSMLCRRLDMVGGRVRSARLPRRQRVAEYRRSGTVCGVALPAGLEDGSRLPAAIFTPTTKAPLGEHDTPMTYAEVVAEVGEETASRLRELTLAVYERGRDLAAAAGILLADTKIELGGRRRRRARARRRGAHPGLVAVLAGRDLAAGRRAAVVRQAVRARLAEQRLRLGPWLGRATPPLPDEVVEPHPGEVRRGLRAAHRPHFAAYLRSA